MGQKHEERRKYPRVPLNLLIQFRFDTFEAFISEYASDISEGGMFIRCEDAREEGSMVYLQFGLKDGTRLIEGLGRVVRVNPKGSSNPGMGVEFVNFDEESRQMIEAIVRERSTAPTEDIENPSAHR
jgi:type IV pilus assembly protein PilZ